MSATDILLDPVARPVIAHRGASGEYPENTMRAFAEALAEGADAIELDVRTSADGVPVVLHDATLERTTNGTGQLSRLTAAQLARLNAGPGEVVPTLAQVLEAFPGTPLVIELKEPTVADPVLSVVRALGAEHRVVVAAAESAPIEPFRNSGIPRAATRIEVAAAWARARLGVGWPVSYHAFTVPERSGRLLVVDRAFVTRARRSGLPVHVWTVNDPRDAARLRAIGVSGIITDYPARMRGLA